jgi:hypothetical protein
MSDELKFDFDFEGADSSQMLNQTRHKLLNLRGTLGPGEKDTNDDNIRGAEEYFASLQDGKLEFTKAEPTVFPLNRDYFKKNNLPIPKNLEALSAQSKFFWVEMPVFLVPGKWQFYKLQMLMEFDKDLKERKKISKVHSAFPESKFAEGIKFDGLINFGLGEDLRFKVAAGIDDVTLPSSIPLVEASAGGKLAVDAKAASRFSIVAGPFSWASKRALVDCRFAGEQVLWTISDKKSLQENSPVFIVILMTPADVVEVRLKASAQAHRLAPLTKFIARSLGLLSPKEAEWLKKGSPITLPPRSYLINTQ